MNRRLMAGAAVAAGLVLSVSACGPEGDGEAAGATSTASAAGHTSSPGARASGSGVPSASDTVSAAPNASASTAAPSGSAVPASPLAASDSASPVTSLSATANGPVPSGTAALPASDKAAGNCQSRQLRWTLVHLEHAQAASGDPAVARLTAQNGGGAACAFDGYPWFRVHVGKGLEVVAVAARTAPARLVLAPGHSAVVDLHYSEVPGTGGICYFPSDDLAQGQVLAPHAAPHEVGLGLRMTDAHGKRMAIAVCENHMWMSAPVMK